MENHTFLFADLSGYTALTEAHGDQRAADLAGQFFSSVRALLGDYGADEVKSIGDALMLHVTDAEAAVRLAVRIVGDVGGRSNFPAVRAGVHTGPAVQRDGDWFGATVNVAARVADGAGEGEVLVTRSTRDALAAEHPELELRSRGPRRLKNVRDPVELFVAVTRAEDFAHGYPIDPVCRMAVDTAVSTERAEYRGQEYHFCSPACHDAFRADPAHYARRGRQAARRDLRVSDDARERAVGELRRAFRKGRITHQELEERVERAYEAATRADLSAVLADVPHRSLARRRSRWQRFWWIIVGAPLRILRRRLRRLRHHR